MFDLKSHVSVISDVCNLVTQSSLYFLNVLKCPTGLLPYPPMGCPRLLARASFLQILSFYPSSEGAQITFPGLWPNLDQSQGFPRAFILTADILFFSLTCCTLFPLAWDTSLNLRKCCTAFQKGVIGECHPSEESTYAIPVPQDRSVNTCELQQLFSEARNSRTNP